MNTASNISVLPNRTSPRCKHFDFVSPNDRKAAWEKIQNRIQGTQKGYLEYEALKKDGSPFHALALSVPIAVDGVPVGIRGFILDITKRKQAEEALRKSEENYHFIADHTADHIWTMDMFMRFTYSSPSVIKTLGYTADEFMARKIDEFFTPESLVDAQKLLAEELETRKRSDRRSEPQSNTSIPSPP
jgi:PAS domain-containing protein